MTGEELYKKLYPLEDTDYWVVLDEIELKLLLRKETTTYDYDTYDYLKNHPNSHLANIIECYEKDGRLTVYEEYIQGRTLEMALKNGGMPFDEARRIFLEICDGIRFMHKAEKTMVHGCINESNIMLTNSGTVKIIDFDDTRIVDEKDSLINDDLYALGIIGKKIFRNNYKRVFSKATNINPAKRYHSIDELIEDVDLIVIKSKPLFPPPGFRSGKIIKGVIAVFFYIVMALNVARDVPKDTFFHYKGLNVLSWCTVYFLIIDIWTEWTGMMARLPGVKHKNITVNVLSRIGYSIVVIFGVDYFLGMFDTFTYNILK